MLQRPLSQDSLLLNARLRVPGSRASQAQQSPLSAALRMEQRHQKQLARALTYWVLGTLLLVLVLTALSLMPGALANIIRLSSVCVLPGFVFLSSLRLTRAVERGKFARTLTSFLLAPLILLPIISVANSNLDPDLIASNGGFEAILRLIPICIHTLNIIILFPRLMAQFQDVSPFVDSLARAYVNICAGLTVLALLFWVSGKNPTLRLGYPLAAGVFAYYIILAWLVTATVYPNTALNILFSIAVVASGSRTSAGLLGIFFLVFAIQHSRRTLVILVLAIIGVLIWYARDPDLLRPFLVERTEVTSGRGLIWKKAFVMMQRSPVLGYGEPQQVDVSEFLTEKVQEEEGEIGTHNAFIDASLTYGAPYAIFLYVVWITYFWPRRDPRMTLDPRRRQFYRLQVGLMVAVAVKSMVTNTFWINMGDAATLFASMILLCPIRRFGPEVTAQSLPSGPTAQPGRLPATPLTLSAPRQPQAKFEQNGKGGEYPHELRKNGRV